ncbi:helix-turn-helix transcriptional regulator [Kitasatospora sp. NPDC006786]|uniref:helix-turn-helix domain-containing protein n=1 Tax=unclassified Kitasatospora TaxID=2633591 RepID=UPI0033D0D230
MTLSTLETLRLTIAAIRQRTGESQRDLAAAVGLTQDKVSRRQSGAQSWSLDEVDVLAGHWGMGPLDLLSGPTHAAQSMTWPPGTAAPAPSVPATFAPAVPVPAVEVPPVPVAVPGASTPPTPVPPVAAVPAASVASVAASAPVPADPEAPAAVQQPAVAPPSPAPVGPTAPAPAAEAPVPVPVPVPAEAGAANAAPVPMAEPTALPAPTVEHQPAPMAEPAVSAATAEQLTVDPALVGKPSADYDRGPDGAPALHPAVPCEQCGRPVTHRIAGRPLHLGGWCAPAPGTAPAAGVDQADAVAAPTTTPVPAAPGAVPAAPAPAPAPAAAAPAPAAAAPASASSAAPRSGPTARSREYAGTGRELGYYLDMITSAVERALEEHDGDLEAAEKALEKKAIPAAMELFDATRVGAAYEHTAYPERLEFLSKKTRSGADEIWEGRHKWENAPLMARLTAGADPVTVDVLDTNAAYCSALKTHLPIGALVHRPDGGWDPKRSGVYLLPARPAWDHPHLPDPIGNRHEAGPVLLDEATVRLLIRCHKLGLTDAPHITEAWTSGSSEGLLEKFRRVLTIARENAIADGDTITEKYVKAMYAKFASTIGESTYNRDIRRPDWMHIIRSQAFANLWYKSQRAHKAGLTVVALRGTDELHVTGGEWRKAHGGVFEEGRLTTQLKLKDQYTLPRTRNRSA